MSATPLLTRDEIESMRGLLKMWFPNKSGERADFNRICDQAALIVRAVNSHAELVAALQALYDACEQLANEDGGDFGDVVGPAAEQAEEALRRATEGQ